jgi:large subunit ribosomal protein L25
MEEISLEVRIRNEVGSQKVKIARREAMVPCVAYGGDRGPTSLKVERKVYERIRRQHAGESIIFHLNVYEGDKKLRDYSAIVKEEQLDPVTDEIVHIDFHRISLLEEIEVKVPVVAKGEAIGVKRDGGSLEHGLWELEVVCLPTKIPQHINVDVSGLEIGDSIHVRDIRLPEGVVTPHDPDAVVFTVAPPQKEEEPTVKAPGAAELEVIKEKKVESTEKK